MSKYMFAECNTSLWMIDFGHSSYWLNFFETFLEFVANFPKLNCLVRRAGKKTAEQQSFHLFQLKKTKNATSGPSQGQEQPSCVREVWQWQKDSDMKKVMQKTK